VIPETFTTLPVLEDGMPKMTTSKRSCIASSPNLDNNSHPAKDGRFDILFGERELENSSQSSEGGTGMGPLDCRRWCEVDK